MEKETAVYENIQMHRRKKQIHSRSTKMLDIFHMNIRSVEANFDEFWMLLRNIGYVPDQKSHPALEYMPDIIILTETRSLSAPTLYQIEDYNIFYNDGDINQNDGSLFYVKETIVITVVKVKCIGKIKIIEADVTLGKT